MTDPNKPEWVEDATEEEREQASRWVEQDEDT